MNNRRMPYIPQKELNELKQLTSMGECQAHWDRLERCNRQELVESLVKQDQESRHLLHRMGRSLYSFFRPFKEFDARESAEHIVLRKVFCDAFRLRDWDERGRQFDFSLYLRRSLSEIVCSLIEISLLAWGVLAACFVTILIVVAANGQIADHRVFGHGEEPAGASRRALASGSGSGSGSGECGEARCDGVSDRWDCAYCAADQQYVDGAGLYLRLLIGAGWSLLFLRFLLVLWIRQARSKFLRKHAGVYDEASLEETLRQSCQRQLLAEAPTPQDARKTLTTHSFDVHDINGDGQIDKDEFKRMQSRARMAKAHEHVVTTDPSHAHIVNMFDEAKTKQMRRKKTAEVRAVQTQLSEGVWIGGRPELYMSALGVAKIIEAFYFALILLNGVTTAGLVLGPSSWWLILLLVLPVICSSQLATLIVRDFAIMYAICKASADVLMEVEHTTTVMQRSYEELRAQFHTMFVRAHDETSDILELCYEGFKSHDVDADGTLSHKEFAHLVRTLTGEAASTKMVRKLLRMIDIDQSGKVCSEEFLRFAAPLDKDHDGRDVDIEVLERRIGLMVQNHERETKLRLSTSSLHSHNSPRPEPVSV